MALRVDRSINRPMVKAMSLAMVPCDSAPNVIVSRLASSSTGSTLISDRYRAPWDSASVT